MRSIRISAVLALVLAQGAFAQTAPSPARTAAQTITPEDVKARIAYLASDAMRGRDTPSPGLDAAARYVADQFASFGLKPAGDSGTFIQRWPYSARRLDVSKVSATLHGKSLNRALEFGKDFFALPSPAVDSLTGSIVFAGAASAESKATAGYGGKIVAFTVPGSELNEKWGDAVRPALISAIGAGARGVVIILDSAFTAETISSASSALAQSLVPIPVIGISNQVARAWLAGDVDLSVPVTGPKEIATATLQVRAGTSGVSGNPPNVVGILEGSDPTLKDTYVIYSAHIDHVGVGAPNAKGDSIYNGADDDASGTTGVIEVAQAFTSMKERPKRSVIFLLVSGEEKGLFGSKYFTEHTPVPVDRIVADINIDMIGRNNPDTTVAIGQEYSTLGPTTQAVVKAHPELHLIVAPDLWPEEGLFFRSDHYNFATKKIPAIFFTSGLHKDYHQPSDEPQFIDNDKLARTARLVFWLGYDIANNATAPAWTPAGLKAINQPGN
ncbi:MAG TPA: M20/M25/M40 family metallo-hydrolase [Longimicrobiales bacterium]